MERNVAFVGGQNGDEGKGKLIDAYMCLAARQMKFLLGEMPASAKKILNYRWQGGANAGHTVIFQGRKYALHQLPSGCLNKAVYAFLGAGMYIHPRKLMEESLNVIEGGHPLTSINLGISSQAHMTLDFHTVEDEVNFKKAEHTSTGNGIRQTGRDKYDRVGIRFVEFLDDKLMAEILEGNSRGKMPSEECMKVSQSYAAEREFLSQFLQQESRVFSDPKFFYGLGEGAQAVLLDVDYGMYPGITSSRPSLPEHRPDTVVGVFKAYVSSVGIGDRPFVTEFEDRAMGSRLVDCWDEYGTTTKKPRHIGWFDAVAGRYAVKAAHMDCAVLTCLDRLEEFHKTGQRIKVAYAYEVNGRSHDEWDVSFDRRDTLRNAKPLFMEFAPWEKTLEKDGKTLTPNAQKYVDALEQLLETRFIALGTGFDREAVIIRKNVWE